MKLTPSSTDFDKDTAIQSLCQWLNESLGQCNYQCPRGYTQQSTLCTCMKFLGIEEKKEEQSHCIEYMIKWASMSQREKRHYGIDQQMYRCPIPLIGPNQGQIVGQIGRAT
eukprot:15325249-Ditylum_brightwellii.AAC.1